MTVMTLTVATRHCSRYETTCRNLVKTLAFRVKIDLGLSSDSGSALF